MNTLEQQYAAGAYRRVKAFEQRHPDKEDTARKYYGTMAQKLPVLIRSAGLAQALAFVDAKASGTHEEPYRQLLGDLAQVLGYPDAGRLLEASREAGLVDYMRLSRKAVLALTWFKRFAQSVLDVEPTEEMD